MFGTPHIISIPCLTRAVAGCTSSTPMVFGNQDGAVIKPGSCVSAQFVKYIYIYIYIDRSSLGVSVKYCVFSLTPFKHLEKQIEFRKTIEPYTIGVYDWVALGLSQHVTETISSGLRQDLGVVQATSHIVLGRLTTKSASCWTFNSYPLVMTNIAIEHGHRNSEFSH